MSKYFCSKCGNHSINKICKFCGNSYYTMTEKEYKDEKNINCIQNNMKLIADKDRKIMRLFK
jgi:hypothetical protein